MEDCVTAPQTHSLTSKRMQDPTCYPVTCTPAREAKQPPLSSLLAICKKDEQIGRSVLPLDFSVPLP